MPLRGLPSPFLPIAGETPDMERLARKGQLLRDQMRAQALDLHYLVNSLTDWEACGHLFTRDTLRGLLSFDIECGLSDTGVAGLPLFVLVGTVGGITAMLDLMQLAGLAATSAPRSLADVTTFRKALKERELLPPSLTSILHDVGVWKVGAAITSDRKAPLREMEKMTPLLDTNCLVVAFRERAWSRSFDFMRQTTRHGLGYLQVLGVGREYKGAFGGKTGALRVASVGRGRSLDPITRSYDPRYIDAMWPFLDDEALENAWLFWLEHREQQHQQFNSERKRMETVWAIHLNKNKVYQWQFTPLLDFQKRYAMMDALTPLLGVILLLRGLYHRERRPPITDNLADWCTGAFCAPPSPQLELVDLEHSDALFAYSGPTIGPPDCELADIPSGLLDTTIDTPPLPVLPPAALPPLPLDAPPADTGMQVALQPAASRADYVTPPPLPRPTRSALLRLGPPHKPARGAGDIEPAHTPVHPATPSSTQSSGRRCAVSAHERERLARGGAPNRAASTGQTRRSRWDQRERTMPPPAALDTRELALRKRRPPSGPRTPDDSPDGVAKRQRHEAVVASAVGESAHLVAHRAPWVAELAVRWDNRGGCTFCGQTDHRRTRGSTVVCPALKQRQPEASQVTCFYPYCVSLPGRHQASACTTLARRCSTCGLRGHHPDSCNGLQSLLALEVFERYADDHALCKARWDRPRLGFLPLPFRSESTGQDIADCWRYDDLLARARYCPTQAWAETHVRAYRPGTRPLMDLNGDLADPSGDFACRPRHADL